MSEKKDALANIVVKMPVGVKRLKDGGFKRIQRESDLQFSRMGRKVKGKTVAKNQKITENAIQINAVTAETYRKSRLSITWDAYNRAADRNISFQQFEKKVTHNERFRNTVKKLTKQDVTEFLKK